MAGVIVGAVADVVGAAIWRDEVPRAGRKLAGVPAINTAPTTMTATSAIPESLILESLILEGLIPEGLIPESLILEAQRAGKYLFEVKGLDTTILR